MSQDVPVAGCQDPGAWEAGTIGLEVVSVALRALDRDILEPLLAAIEDCTASQDIVRAVSAVGLPDALRLILRPVGSASTVFKIERRRTAWRRLGDVLDGRLDPGQLVQTYDKPDLDVLISLMQSCIRGDMFAGMRYPLDATELASMQALVDVARAARHETTPSLPGSHKSSIPGHAGLGSQPLRTRREEMASTRVQTSHPNHSLSACINRAVQMGGLRLPKGVMARFIQAVGPTWAAQNLLQIHDALVVYIEREQAVEVSTQAMLAWLQGEHAIPPAIASGTVAGVVLDPEWTPSTLASEFGPRLVPYLPAMHRALALQGGRTRLLAHLEAGRLHYLQASLGEGDVEDALVTGDIDTACTRLLAHSATMVRAVFAKTLGVEELDAIQSVALLGDGRPAELVRTLIPAMGSNLPRAAANIARLLGADGPGATAFAHAVGQGQRLSDEHRRQAARARQTWERSLVNVEVARGLLGATPTEFSRWVDARLVPVAMRVDFHKWGRTLQANLYDPLALEPIRALVATWRAKHAEELSVQRRAAARLRVAAPPTAAQLERARVRRLAGLLQSAGVHARARTDCLDVPVAFDIGDGTTWHCSVRVRLPAPVLAAIQPEGEAASGRARQALVEALQGLAETTRRQCLGALDAVFEAWTLRADAVMEDFGQDRQRAFLARLGGQVGQALEANRRSGAMPQAYSPQVLGPAFGALLESALAQASVLDVRERGNDDLRVRSGLADYAAMFPTARAMRRRFVLHLGPTNSGKTHKAMDMLARAGSGTYLAPLRLMALEGAERLNLERGVPTDMVTGEEIVRVEGAQHVSSTVEMADLGRVVDVAIIDEIQLVADHDRGWAWTQALVGIPARTVVMTGSVDALPFVARIARMTGDELEVTMFERLTPLDAMDKPVALNRVQAGDALVAFSRSEVLRLREEVSRTGLSVAVVYGALGPEVRRVQAARFRSGEAQVLVATDAIAMGLNLPIQRVLLSSATKYDGVGRRLLNASEIRQICGRAGRYGLAESGLAGGLEGGAPSDMVCRALAAVPTPPEDTRVPVMAPWAAVEATSQALGSDDLGAILVHITSTLLDGSPDLRATSLDDALVVVRAIKHSRLGLQDRFRYLGCPIEARVSTSVDTLAKWAGLHGAGQPVPSPHCSVRTTPDQDSGLETCERAVKEISAYLWLSMRYPEIYCWHERAVAERERVNALIDAALCMRTLSRSCRQCGSRLPRNHRFPICNSCHGSGKGW